MTPTICLPGWPGCLWPGSLGHNSWRIIHIAKTARATSESGIENLIAGKYRQCCCMLNAQRLPRGWATLSDHICRELGSALDIKQQKASQLATRGNLERLGYALSNMFACQPQVVVFAAPLTIRSGCPAQMIAVHEAVPALARTCVAELLLQAVWTAGQPDIAVA